jgi:import inner membrane translocase subunit TIM23
MNFGLDPLMVTGFSAIGMMAIGWLVGPFFGNAIFNLRYRSIRSDLEIVRNILPLRNSPVSIYRL